MTVTADTDVDLAGRYGAPVPENPELVTRAARAWSRAEYLRVLLDAALDVRDDAVRALADSGVRDSAISAQIDAHLDTSAAAAVTAVNRPTATNVRAIRNRRADRPRVPAAARELAQAVTVDWRPLAD